MVGEEWTTFIATDVEKVWTETKYFHSTRDVHLTSFDIHSHSHFLLQAGAGWGRVPGVAESNEWRKAVVRLIKTPLRSSIPRSAFRGLFQNGFLDPSLLWSHSQTACVSPLCGILGGDITKHASRKPKIYFLGFELCLREAEKTRRKEALLRLRTRVSCV